ncbi:hypothetical protein WG936_09510 [Corynebacterium sp. H127]|uniref:hypothetical protein n=1 Tax=Corynebacterium sp. H127 TaxID=3133418 RepID=UPI0030B69BEF
MQLSLGMRAMYGKLYSPGTLGQLMAWEGAGWIVILSCVMMVLLTFRCYRRAEGSSLGELPRATGIRKLDIAGGTLLLLGGVAFTLGAGITAVLLALGSYYGEISTSGAFAYGTAVGLAALGTGVLSGALSLLLASEHSLARVGMLTVGAGFMSRAFADIKGLDFFNWITPLGWFGLVRPFTEDRWWVLLTVAIVTATIAVLWLLGERDRVFGMGILPVRENHAPKQRQIESGWKLRRILDQGFHYTWVITGFTLAAFMTSLSSSANDMLGEDETTGKIFKDMFGDADLEAAFLVYMADFLGIMLGVAAVASVLKIRAEERDRHVDLLRSRGIKRELPMQLQAASSIAFILKIILATVFGSILGVLAVSKHPEEMWQLAASANASQVAPMLALAGLTALLIGLWPQRSWVAWLPVMYSGTVTIIAPLFKAPQWLLESSAFGHSIHTDDTSAWPAWIVLLVVGAVSFVLAWVFAAKRAIT